MKMMRIAAFRGLPLTGQRSPISGPMASQEIEALSAALGPPAGPRPALGAAGGAVAGEAARDRAGAAARGARRRCARRCVECAICGNVDTRDPCGICADPRRDARQLCVVEDVADLWALDRARLFTGNYHVLGGRLSALDGVRPEDLTIGKLIARVAAGGIDEVVLAMNATLEGQTTAHYIAERLEGFPVRVTQLAHGLPVGGELDYLDEGTLAQALRAAARRMKRSWIVGGWLFAMAASALPALVDRSRPDPAQPAGQVRRCRDRRVDGLSLSRRSCAGGCRSRVPVSLLALACMVMNRPRDPR